VKMRRWAAAVVAAMTVGVAGSILVAVPAQASFDWCHGSSVVCFAEHNDGNGIRWGPRSFPYGACVNVPSNLVNKISSLWNKYGWDSQSPPLQVTLYDGNCSDGNFSVLFTWGPSAYVQYVGWLNNDKADAACVGPRHQGYCR